MWCQKKRERVRVREGVTQKNAASVNWRRFVPSGSIVSLLITLHCASRNSHFSDCTTYSAIYDFVVLLYLRLLCTKCQTWAVATGTKQRNMHCPIFHPLVTTQRLFHAAVRLKILFGFLVAWAKINYQMKAKGCL